MKYVIIQGDGMSDFPVPSLGGLTPLEKAHTPNMDRLARDGRLGLARTIPHGFPSGTDVGTMTILGYDPARYHTGRSPIEAASMGIDLADGDIAFRCNLVTIEERDGVPVMSDFTAGHIGSDDAAELINAIDAELGSDELRFYPGVSYRHVLVWKGGPATTKTTPPHDITDKAVGAWLPDGDRADKLAELSDAARQVIAASPVNARRLERGEKAATDIWLWGQGPRPAVPTLNERFGITSGLITAVDVVGGLGRLAGMERIQVPGITGFVDTNYVGKGEYALAALEDHDLVFIHVESTDETGHMGDADLKVQAIEDLDEKVIGTILNGIERFGDYRIMVLPDHATPVSTKTHADDPVPFAIFDSRSSDGSGRQYSEAEAGKTGDMVEAGHELISQFLGAAS
jgi:2,3-bisphosphoglycerate-independent phosphoglycerate mutase